MRPVSFCVYRLYLTRTPKPTHVCVVCTQPGWRACLCALSSPSTHLLAVAVSSAEHVEMRHLSLVVSVFCTLHTSLDW